MHNRLATVIETSEDNYILPSIRANMAKLKQNLNPQVSFDLCFVCCAVLHVCFFISGNLQTCSASKFEASIRRWRYKEAYTFGANLPSIVFRFGTVNLIIWAVVLKCIIFDKQFFGKLSRAFLFTHLQKGTTDNIKTLMFNEFSPDPDVFDADKFRQFLACESQAIGCNLSLIRQRLILPISTNPSIWSFALLYCKWALVAISYFITYNVLHQSKRTRIYSCVKHQLCRVSGNGFFVR